MKKYDFQTVYCTNGKVKQWYYEINRKKKNIATVKQRSRIKELNKIYIIIPFSTVEKSKRGQNLHEYWLLASF